MSPSTAYIPAVDFLRKKHQKVHFALGLCDSCLDHNLYFKKHCLAVCYLGAELI